MQNAASKGPARIRLHVQNATVCRALAAYFRRFQVMARMTATDVVGGVPTGRSGRYDDGGDLCSRKGQARWQGVSQSFASTRSRCAQFRTYSIGPSVIVRLAHIEPELNAAMEQCDTHTASHCSRVGMLAVALAAMLGFSDEQLMVMGVAARMHDVGKIEIPDSILRKPGALSSEEWTIMRTHSVRGESIIRADETLTLRNDVGLIIRHHHEHFDGSGYPDELGGEEIPLAARLLSVVDSYDAMTESRTYHRVRTHQEVMAVLDSERGSKHDPHMVDLIHSCDERWLLELQGVK